MIRFLLPGVALVALWIVVSASGGAVSEGRLAALTAETMPESLNNQILLVEGRVYGEQPVLLVIRADDAASEGYASRYNNERQMPSGPFRIELPLSGLATPDGRVLDPASLSFVTAFTRPELALNISVRKFQILEAPRLPDDAVGLDFGGAGSALFSGFRRVTATDPDARGKVVSEISRPQPDPLTRDGLRGVETVTIPWPHKAADLTLWTEDPGAWETLPQRAEHRISVNGKVILDHRMSPDEWIRKRYLASRGLELQGEADPWTLYGKRMGGRITARVEAVDGQLVIRLQGGPPWGTFLSAALVEPVGDRRAARFVAQERAKWFRSAWPVLKGARTRPGWPVAQVAIDGGMELAVAPGTAVIGELLLPATGETLDTGLFLESGGLPEGWRVRFWSAHRRLERSSPAANSLVVSERLLRPVGNIVSTHPGFSRRVVMRISVPAGAPPGTTRVKIRLQAAGRTVHMPVFVEVLPVALPAAQKPAGFYLDEAPHLKWFDSRPEARSRQLRCDAEFIRSFGLTNLAPGLSTPLPGKEREFSLDARNSRARTLLAYAPAKRLLAALGPKEAARQIARVRKLTAQRIIWSVADEPSNPASVGADLRGWVQTIKAVEPSVAVAGHLNSLHDQSLAQLFDTLIVNPGFGIDLDRLAMLRREGRRVWIYNTWRPRLTAGLWLWRSEAEAFVQWHGRMPTADPYNPLDGREDDMAVFPPMARVCSETPDISEDLLLMSEGVLDQRWLLWLQDQRSPEATALLARIRGLAGRTWETARTLRAADLARIRADIISLAQRL
ncbi:MAG: hypothetical protein AAF441_06505 [Pseudomonadota bacterium]